MGFRLIQPDQRDSNAEEEDSFIVCHKEDFHMSVSEAEILSRDSEKKQNRVSHDDLLEKRKEKRE